MNDADDRDAACLEAWRSGVRTLGAISERTGLDPFVVETCFIRLVRAHGARLVHETTEPPSGETRRKER